MGLIRLLLALSVVTTHCGSIFGLNFVGGQIAVQSFYIISGFYMSLILNEKYIGENRSYKLFITNRFIRLYPIYWTTLLCTILFCIGLGLVTKGQTFGQFNAYGEVKPNIFSFGFLGFTNLAIFGQDVVMFLGITPETGSLYFTANVANTHPPLHTFLFIPQAWTLGLELSFYLIAPFILRRGSKIIFILIALSCILRCILYSFLNLQHEPWTYRFFPIEIMFFLFGYLSYRMHLILLKKPLPISVSYFTLGLVIVFLIVYPFLPSIKINFLSFSVKELTFFATIIMSIPILFNFFKKNRLDNKIGELSYPVYISHLLVFSVCGYIGTSVSLPFLKKGWVVAFATIVVAFMLNRFVASPIEKYRQSRLKKTKLGPG